MSVFARRIQSRIMNKIRGQMNKYRNTLITLISIVALGYAANAYPGVAACVVATDNNQYSTKQKLLLQEARGRIENIFGPMQSRPIILFFDEQDAFWPLTLNEYGSTSSVGNKTCVMIGPKGQNIDVTAHELMHAEVVLRVGRWQKWFELPVWFDEGLAMQVDYRGRYDLPKDSETSYVTQLDSVAEFYVSDDKQLTRNYASAKYEVAKWMSVVGNASAYQHLDSIKDGGSFAAIWRRSK